MYNIAFRIEKTYIEHDGLPVGQGFEPILAWRLKWMPWLDVGFDPLTIGFEPASIIEGFGADVTCASLATLIHEIGHIMEAGPDRICVEDYDLYHLSEVDWTPELPPDGSWARYELQVRDHNQAIRVELNVIYLVYDVLYRTKWGSWAGEDLQILFYDEREQFQPEYWQVMLDTTEGFNEAPAWVRETSERLWRDHADMMQDLVDALRDALQVRERHRGR